jgi:hypothetical protein
VYKITYNIINNKERPNYLSISKNLSTGLDEPVKSKFIRSVKGNPYRFYGILSHFTPLKIYNGTTLPINELKGKSPTEICPILHLFTFQTPIIYDNSAI